MTIGLALAGGGSVLVEVDAEEAAGIDRMGRPGAVVQETSETLQDALERMQPAVQAVLDKMRDLPKSPDKVQVQFGIKLSAESGVVVAKAATEANFVVTVEWSQDDSGQADLRRR